MVMPEQTLTIAADALWRLSVEQYHEMLAQGILTEDDPVELLEGWLITKMPKNRAYSLVIQLTREQLERLIPEGYYVDAQEPVTTADSEPEPDVMIVRGTRRAYLERHPNGSEVALVIEVSDATLQRDRSLKLRLYARAGIPQYWIINLPEKVVEVHSTIEEGTYQTRTNYHADEKIIVMIDEQRVGEILVKDILP